MRDKRVHQKTQQGIAVNQTSGWRKALYATTILTAVLPSGAIAAGTDQTTAVTAPETIEEVTVTARRKVESLENVPVAVTVLGATELAEKSIVTAADLQFHVPSLQENNGAYFLGAEPSFVLRGLSTTSPGTNADPSVETYFNEVPMLNTRQIADELYDLQSVQVLRGPQGTLFGKNSDGGAILFSPNKPSDEFEGMAQAEVGNYDLVQLTGMVNAPLGDDADLRLSTRFQDRGPYIQNVSGPGMDTSHYWAGRAQLEIRPTSRLTNDTMVDGYDSREQGTALIPINFSGTPYGLYTGCPTPTTCPFGLTQAQYNALVPVPISQQLSEQQAWGPRKVSSPLGNPISLDVYTITNITTYQLTDDLLLKNIAGYQHQRTAWFLSQANEPTPMLDDDFHDRQSQISEEFQVQGKSLPNNRLDWVMGAYYANQKENNSNLNIILPPLITNDIFSVSNTDSKALYAQGTYDLGDLVQGLDFTGGYRYSWDTKSQDVNFYAGGILYGQTPTEALNIAGADVCQLNGTGPSCLRALSKTFSAPNWTIGMDYHLNDQAMIYVASRKGYKAGGFNPTSADNAYAEYGPETVEDVELGAKTQFHLMGAPVQFNIAIYRGDYGDATVAPVLPYFGDSTQVVENVLAGAVVEGGELEAIINPIEGSAAQRLLGPDRCPVQQWRPVRLRLYWNPVRSRAGIHLAEQPAGSRQFP